MLRPELVVSTEESSTNRSPLVRESVLVYLDELYRFALRLTRDAGQANELVQECALRALEWQNRVVRNPRSWLFQTLYHIFVDHRRKRMLRGAYAEEFSGEERETESAVNSLPNVMAVEDVRTAVEGLPPQFRAVVWLSDAEGFALREVAEILECPLGTVASRLARGRQELRQRLSAYGPQGRDRHDLR
jgi:RNA polymerase sigma-70 factor, ECF subfamily